MSYLRLTLTDTLGFWDDDLGDYIFDPENSKSFTTWFRLPDGWLFEGRLLPERREQLFEFFYGPGWRGGNGDGSKFIVLDSREHELSEAERAGRVWTLAKETCYIRPRPGGH